MELVALRVFDFCSQSAPRGSRSSGISESARAALMNERIAWKIPTA
jgi:hypothetical protein